MLDLLGNFAKGVGECFAISSKVRHSERSHAQFTNLFTEDLIQYSRIFRRHPDHLSKYPATKTAEVLMGLIDELNRRGMLSQSVLLVQSQVKSPNSIYRKIDPSLPLRERLIALSVAAIVANFYLLKVDSSERPLTEVLNFKRDDALRILDRLHFSISHPEGKKIAAEVEDVRDHLRLFGESSSEFASFAEKDCAYPSVLEALEDFYKSHPRCVGQISPRYRRDIEYKALSRAEVTPIRVHSMLLSLETLFDEQYRPQHEVGLFTDWATGSSEADIFRVVNGLSFSDKGSPLRLLGVKSVRTTSDERIARSCLERILQAQLLVQVLAERNEFDEAFNLARSAIKEAQRIPQLGRIDIFDVYNDFAVRYKDNSITAEQRSFWKPTAALKSLAELVTHAHFFDGCPELRTLRLEFKELLTAYNNSRVRAVASMA